MKQEMVFGDVLKGWQEHLDQLLRFQFWLAAILDFFFPKRLAHDLGENLNFGYFIVLGKIESKNGLWCCFGEVTRAPRQ